MSDSTPEPVLRTFLVEWYGHKKIGRETEVKAEAGQQVEDGGLWFTVGDRVVGHFMNVISWMEKPSDDTD